MINDRGQRGDRSAARTRILELVVSCDSSVSVRQLAEMSGSHGNTVREHLDALRASGLITRQSARSGGRGRPIWLYRATPAASRPANGYAGLANALADQWEHSEPHPREAAIVAGERWGVDLAKDGSHEKNVRDQVLSLLDELGFDPDPDSVDGRVRLRNCPMIDTASRHPDVVCGVHLGMVRGILRSVGGDPDSAELLAFYEPDACHLVFGSGAPDRTGGQRGSPGRGLPVAFRSEHRS